MRIPFPSCPTLCALVVLGLPAVGGAQATRDTTKVERKGQRLEAVSISATRSAAVVSGAAAVVVRPAEIRASPAPMLEQALKEAPFVLVRQNSRGEAEISVRGSDSRQSSVLLNGVPITLGWDHRTDPSLVPITGAERLVVVRGLGSLLNGPNSLGGTIEVSHDGFSESASGRAWAGAGIDQNGATVGSLGLGRRLAEIRDGALSLSVGAAHRHRDGLSLPAGAFDSTARRGLRTGTDLRQVDGFASLRWSRVGGRSLGVLVSAYDAEKGVPPEEHIRSPRLWRYPYNRRVIAMASASTGLISSRLGLGSFEVGAGINHGSLKIESYADRSYTSVSAQELGDERTASLRTLLTHSLGAAMLRASFSAADIRYEETLTPAAAVDYRQKLSSAGVEVEAPVGQASKLVGGFVFDRASTPETGGRTPKEETFSSPGWRVGISHELSPRASWHVSVSDRARFPSLRELYSGALNRFQPNPDLVPESLLGFEGGVTVSQFLPAITQSSLQVIGFRHRLDDAVVRITLANPTRFMRVNRDRIESTGVELLGGLVFGAESGRAVTLSGDLALQRIRVIDETAGDQSRHAENNPETRGRLELGLPLPAQLRAAATARFSGRQYCLNADTQREDELQGRLMSDVSVQRDFALSGNGPFKRLRAMLGLDNVGDVTAYDQCGLPQPGRTLRLTMSAR
jgi:iron complex outermembrane receptor protein